MTAYFGVQDFNALQGCCKSTPYRSGIGLDLRLKTLGGVWEGFGYTDRMWAEISVLKTIYLSGGFAENDPGTGEDVKVLRMRQWQFLTAVGGGFFIHTTTTEKYDLPAVVNGFLFVGHLETQYMINDRWAASGLVRGAAALSLDNLGFVTAFMGGLLYRF